MKRVVVSGGWSYGNIGDEVIAKVTIAALRRTFPNAEIVLTSFEPADFFYHHKIKAIESVHSILQKKEVSVDDMISNPNEAGLGDFCDILDQDTVFIMSGGGYFDGGWESQFNARIAEITIAHNCGAKIAILGQSIGPLYSKDQVMRLRCALEKCDFINVRDKSSKNLLTSVLPGKEVSCCCDIALLISDFFPVNNMKKNKVNFVVQAYARHVDNGQLKRKHPVVEKVLRRITGEKLKYDLSYIRLLQNMSAVFNIVQIVMNVESTSKCNNDHFMKHAKKLKKRVPQIEIKSGMSVDEFIFELATAERMISCKMHPLIVSASYGVQTFAISQHYKIDAFMEWIGRKEFCWRNNTWFHLHLIKSIAAINKNNDINSLVRIENCKQEIYEMFNSLKGVMD